jgi:iduronate 2-sulfatase
MSDATRRGFLRTAALAATGRAAPAEPRRNVLLLCVDDLRPALGCYGDTVMHTPHIDRLAATGRVFTRHYVQCAVCGPSRGALLTGKPQASWDCWNALRRQAEPAYPVSFAHLLRRSGYRTVAIGKVSHQPGGVMDNAQTVHQVPFSWDLSYAPVGEWRTPWRAFFGFSGAQAYNKQSLPPAERDEPRLPYEFADVPDTGYPDGLNAAAAVRQLNDLKQRHTHFLLAVGFYKPHLPFCAPKRYWDLYGRNAPLAPNPYPSRGTDPSISGHKSGELTGNYHWPSGAGNVGEGEARILRQGYRACVSYVDAQVGKVLDELARLELDRNTVVILWGDNGWHLGEHAVWGKHTNYEIATRTPLIVRVPGMPHPGTASRGLVETVDLYPSLAEMCGLECPRDLNGASLSPALWDPRHPGKPQAFSFFPRGKLMGRTIRTERYRLVRWTGPAGEVAQTELYDHARDPREDVNVAKQQPDVVKALVRRMPPLSIIGFEKSS